MYLTDVLARMAARHSTSRPNELLPWNWKAAPVNP
ncbi:MAG: transposase domain-containing protein [Hyphomicrobiaceae bacterium]|nr:transposase domain-containing protein [Hyphomicrobiaceae bacterium]